jgi:hypothetical protein
LIFAASAIAAGIAAYMTRGKYTEYPGLSTGLIVALATTVLMYLTGAGGQ